MSSEGAVVPPLQSAWASMQKFARRVPAERLRLVLLVLLSLWIVYGLIQLVWAAMPSEEVQLPVGKPVIGQATASENPGQQRTVDIDLAAVKRWKLFGKMTANPKPAVVQPKVTSTAEDNARETRLQLTLNGIIASNEEKNGRAVITYRGQQEQYTMGQKLPVSGNVTLRRLLDDRVLLNNAGRVEALYLFDKKKAAQATVAAAPEPRPTARTNPANDAFRARLIDNPGAIADILRISEERTDGQLKGYKVMPSRDREQFQKLGFQSGDIVTAVNGIALDNAQSGMQVWQNLRQNSDASFDIEREGEQISLQVSLEDLQD